MHTDFVSLAQARAAQHGDRPAFAFVREMPGRAYQEETLGFADLDRKARTVAARLHELGMRDRTALLLYPEGLDFLTAFLGCLYARVIAVPAPLPELDASRSIRTRQIIRDADITLILTDTAHSPKLTTWMADIGLAGQIRCLATDTGLDTDPADWAPPQFDHETLAFLQYTSGSTSDPKGVMVTHGNLLHNSEEIKRCVHGTPDTIGVGWIPHYHDMGLIGQIIAPLYLGCQYISTSPITFLKRPVLWLELISRHRATNTVAPNFGYELLCRRVTDQAMAGLDLSCLQTAQNGAEPLRADTLERLVKRFAPIGLRPEALAPCYGMAETTLLITGTPAAQRPTITAFDADSLSHNHAVTIDDHPHQQGHQSRRLVSSGQPITLDLQIVEPKTRQPLPDRHVGEIWVRGCSVTQGYWHRPQVTQTTFHAVTANGTGPYLRTGDLGFLADGQLFVTGRIKDLIIVNGVNLYAHDLEETARAAHPALRTAAAFSLDLATDTIGHEQVILVQEISTPAATGTPLAELATLAHDTVSRTYGLPALSVVLCGHGTVRRTTSGKVQRPLTREALMNGQITELASHLQPALAAQLPAAHGKDRHLAQTTSPTKQEMR